jgi:hypothetical protein
LFPAVPTYFHVLRPNSFSCFVLTDSCFALPDIFLAVPRASNPFFMFPAPGHVFSRTEVVESLFHVLRSRSHFRRYRGRRVPFSCFERPDSFSALSGASSPVFMFSAPRLIFGGTEGVRSCLHVLRARTRFRWYRGRRILFSCFVLQYFILAVPRVSGPVFKFSAPGLIFDGTEGVGSRFHFMRSQTHFRWYRGHWVPFSCFARRTRFRRYRGRQVLFLMFCAPGLIFGGTEGV